jgi:hypothetical protein
MGVNIHSSAGTMYKNATNEGTATNTAASPGSQEFYVFSINRLGSTAGLYAGRLGGYSIGLSMTPTQVSSFYSAMQAFQTALTRNV